MVVVVVVVVVMVVGAAVVVVGAGSAVVVGALVGHVHSSSRRACSSPSSASFSAIAGPDSALFLDRRAFLPLSAVTSRGAALVTPNRENLKSVENGAILLIL